MKTQTNFLEYPFIPQYTAVKFQEWLHQKTQWKSQEWPHHKTRWVTMLYLPSYQVNMTTMIILMKRMRIHTRPHNSAKGSYNLTLCYQG